MKNIFTIILTICSFVGFSQEADTTASKGKVNVAVDLMSRYIWRGTDYGASPSIQPTLSFVGKNFEIGAWGAMNFTGTYSEIDLYGKYTAKDFSIIVTDYFVSSFTNPSNSFEKYFVCNNDSTGHLVEAAIQYKNTGNFPIWILVGTFVYGIDKDINGDNRYSTYGEIGYSFECKKTNFDLFVGLTPFEGAYASDFNVVNAGVTAYKTIKITDTFELPLKASIITNPSTQNVFFAVGVTL